MSRLFFCLCGGDSLDYKNVIYFIFRIGAGVGAGVDQAPGVGIGVGTAPPRLRTPGPKAPKYEQSNFQ